MIGLAVILVALLGLVVRFREFFFVFLGRRVALPGPPRLFGRLYHSRRRGEVALLWLSGWRPGPLSITPMDYWAGFLAREVSVPSLTVSLRGQGSPGRIKTLTRRDFLDDALAAYDFLSHRYPQSPIVVVGESFGGYLASVLTSQRRVHALILRVPSDFPNAGFDDVPQVRLAMNKTREWKAARHHHSESFALQAVHDFSGKVVLVASGRDQIVPTTTIENYQAAGPGSLIRIDMPESGHALMSRREVHRFRDLIIDELGLSPPPSEDQSRKLT